MYQFPEINCDMGEGFSNESQLMPMVHSANISCGFHAGTEADIRSAIKLAVKYGVNIGAHPSYPDKENFGRKEMALPAGAIFQLILEQLHYLDRIAKEEGTAITHVKPHGALYNVAAGNRAIAEEIADAIYQFNPQLVLYGLSGSVSLSAAASRGLQTASEVFADRRYADDGSLCPRSHPLSLMQSETECLEQVRRMIREGHAVSMNGKEVPLLAETVCIHGDGPHAAAFLSLLSASGLFKNSSRH